MKLAVAVAGGTRNQPHGLPVQPRRVRIPHLGRSTSVCQRCTHANEIRRRRAATSEAKCRIEQLNTVMEASLGSESFPGRDYSDGRKPGAARGAGASEFVSSRTFQCSVVSVPRVLAACCGTGRMLHLVCGVCAVLRTGCRGQCFTHAAGSPLPAARLTRNAAVPCVSCGSSHVLVSSCMSSAV